MKKTLLTHSLIVISFFIINAIIHAPALFGGKQIDQHDILQAKGGNQNLVEYRNDTGEQPLWNNNTFSGMPAYLTGIQFSGDLLRRFYIGLGLGLDHPTSILFTAMLSFYIMLLCFKVRPLVAFAGAVSFALCGFNTIGLMAGHNSKIAAIALMPLVLGGIHLTFSDKKRLGFALTALALGLQIRANHPQITYYLLLIVIAYGINGFVGALKEKSLKDFATTSGLLVLAAVIAVGANFGRLSTTLEYSSYTIRGKSELSSGKKDSGGLDKEYAFRYSNGITEPLFLLVPNIYGGSSQQALSPKSEVAKALRSGGYNRAQVDQQIQSMPTYWGDQPYTAPYYAGTLVILLFILGMFVLPRKQKIWLVSLVGLGIVMSWGKNFGFNDFLFDYLPGYNKFRSVTFTILITLFAMNLFGFMALEKLISQEWNKELKKKFLTSVGVVGGLLLVLILFSGAFSFRGTVDAQLPEWLSQALREDRQSLLTRDALRALLFVALLATALWSIKAEKLKLTLGLILLCFIGLIDSLSLTKRFLGTEKFAKDPYAESFRPTAVDQELMKSALPGERVLNLQNPFNENRTSYFHESIGGYHGAKMRRYQDLIEYCITNELQQAIQSLQSQSLDFGGLSVLNMLNAKYFYAGAERNGIFPNSYANGNAWTINEIIPVASADEEISQVCTIDTKRQALIDQSKFEIPQISGSGEIVLTEKSPNLVTYNATITGGNAVGVFSEIYYDKGWVAFIDGEESDVLRANYILRALVIPAGTHTVSFKFEPNSYYLGNTITAISGAIILLIFFGTIGLELRSAVSKQPSEIPT